VVRREDESTASVEIDREFADAISLERVRPPCNELRDGCGSPQVRQPGSELPG
jgi:hypothetical protein